MIEITLQNLKEELIGASAELPILLDIWAPWCAPCKALGPVLEKLEIAYAGRFKLAKLNSDEQPELAGQLSQMFGVRSIPFCVMFVGGQPVDGFVGALPEAEIKAFLDKHVPTEAEFEARADVQEAQDLMASGDTTSAIERLQEAVSINPADERARFDYVKALLMAGRVQEAKQAFEPVANQTLLNPQLTACGHWLAAHASVAQGRSIEALQAAISTQKRDFAARFELAQHYFIQQNFERSMDELLEILMRDKAWNNELARKTFVAILELMTPTSSATKAAAPATKSTLELAGIAPAPHSDPVMDGYRRKLSMVLF